VPAGARDEVTDEWLAELAYILRGTESLPISRLVRGTRFAMGLLRGAPAIGRELGKADEGFEAMADGLIPQRVNQAAKRAFDLVAASVLLLLAAPMFLAAALAVRWSSPGPVFFRQPRTDKDGRVFELLKFRTMQVNRDSDTTWSEVGDARMTRVGGLLLRTSMDELPQLLNVLWGQMSLVGPRPRRR
jgi:lipopolysaccharide/colanic/teichoic acid biosynthesis glycosyltransferase